MSAKKKPRKVVVWALVNKNGRVDGAEPTLLAARMTRGHFTAIAPDDAPFSVVRCEGVLE